MLLAIEIVWKYLASKSTSPVSTAPDLKKNFSKINVKNYYDLHWSKPVAGIFFREYKPGFN